MVTVRDYNDVVGVLTDERFGVPEAEPSDELGTIAWLRGSVSRFANGAEHARRRALVEAELALIGPSELRVAAQQRAAVAAPEQLLRHVPMATLAAALGITDPDAAADAAIAIAGGYFPGSDPEAERRADAGVARLLDLIDADLPTKIARITLLVQGCDATAMLIDKAANADLDDVLVHDPPVRAMRRVALAPAEGVAAGDTVTLDIAAANRDGAPSLTFGAGLRPCPGQAQALALAAGVLDAVRAPR